MDEDGLVGFQCSHDHDELPGGKVVHRNCGALECRQSSRLFEDLLHRYTNHVGIPAKPRHRDDVLTDPALVDARSDSVYSTADFVARYNRRGWQIGIYTHAPHDVGEIDPACLDADADLSRVRRGIGGFLDLQNFRRPSSGNPNLSHDDNSSPGCTSLYGRHLSPTMIRKGGQFRTRT